MYVKIFLLEHLVIKLHLNDLNCFYLGNLKYNETTVVIQVSQWRTAAGKDKISLKWFQETVFLVLQPKWTSLVPAWNNLKENQKKLCHALSKAWKLSRNVFNAYAKYFPFLVSHVPSNLLWCKMATNAWIITKEINYFFK